MNANPAQTNVMMMHCVETPKDLTTVLVIAAMKEMGSIAVVCIPI